MRQPAEQDPAADPTVREAVPVGERSRGPAGVDDAGDAGYAKTLQPRHIGMIAIGGAIGTGLFLGAGASLQKAGPGLAVSYAVAGIFAFCVVRALGELVVHRPSSGSFVSYARELLGESGAYVVGWMYVLNWSTTGMADITACALYVHYWQPFTSIPQWVLAFLALVVINLVNGFQALGTLLAVGLMILPAGIARFWSRDITGMICIAVGSAILSGYAGLVLSFETKVPSGPAIILTAAVLYVGSVLFGSVGGLFRQMFPGRHLEA